MVSPGVKEKILPLIEMLFSEGIKFHSFNRIQWRVFNRIKFNETNYGVMKYQTNETAVNLQMVRSTGNH
jgi:hypothetical protein